MEKDKAASAEDALNDTLDKLRKKTKQENKMQVLYEVNVYQYQSVFMGGGGFPPLFGIPLPIPHSSLPFDVWEFELEFRGGHNSGTGLFLFWGYRCSWEGGLSPRLTYLHWGH